MKILLLSLFALFATVLSAESKILNIEDYVTKNSVDTSNYTTIVNEILSQSDINGTTIVFENKEYHFWADKDKMAKNQATTAFNIEGLKNITIDGRGAQFIFHGKMNPFNILESESTIIKNFSLDWHRPYNSQAKILNIGSNYVDFEIDREVYPYKVENDKITFIGEGWEAPIVAAYTNLYDGKTGDMLYQMRDMALGNDFPTASAEEISDNVVRLHFTPAKRPPLGTVTAFFHGKYIEDGIKVRFSKDTYLENIKIYYTLSCGVLGWKSHNITLNNVDIVVNQRKGRVFSTVADATHFNGCSGLIQFEGCEMSGAGDDFMNIHGMYAKITEIISPTKFRVSAKGRYIGFDSGEKAWHIDKEFLERGKTSYVVSQEAVMKDGKVESYIIILKDALNNVEVGDLLENPDRNASLIVRNCRVLKKNRARSILVTTPYDVLIENNYFNSPGASILIEGDTYLWHESGAVRNVTIRNNVFENCYTSGNNIESDPWGWGEGVISITPSVKPVDATTKQYHQNINITGNTFYHFDYAILFARSVDGLCFVNNNMIRTYDYKPFYRPYNITLDGCRDVTIKGNRFDEEFLGKNILINHMEKNEVKLFDELSIENDVDIYELY